ncbi:MAG: UDP-N-acetylmuramoyl-tripeptide--D-alanyl-D-alanine ligase [Clostridia bacterium]|nr:UDP-N-acetylmuramoyl-tripeptide--D-alanyl-D-alanine ligase [Clostridia bacterium]MBQ5792498.1 UDP-N-acetylmuramoyl-tripeptide--D-alanyl-D-alanine ligase [Clostridia bacterium]
MKIKLGMQPMTLAQAAAYCGGELYDFTGCAGVEFSYICTDSREADQNTMFVAIRGERVDGHDYIGQVIEAGCRCILCEYVPQDICAKHVGAVVVEQSVAAFCQLAKSYRIEKFGDRDPMRTIAVTGSVGKTTTKEMVASVLRQELNLYAAQGNFNSEIGMPMSLMSAGAHHRAAVLEMGMSARGEISRMSRTARPSVAMITNVGSSHLEYLGTRENIAAAKLEVADGLRTGGYLLLNADEPLLAGQKSHGRHTIYIGIDHPAADCRAEHIRYTDDGCTVFDIRYGEHVWPDVCVPALGRHMVMAAMYAAVTGKIFGLSEKSIRAGILEYRGMPMRQQIDKAGGVTLLCDCYNASPESVRAALQALSNMPVKGRRIAVLGDMLELGTQTNELHRATGVHAAGVIDVLVTVGELGAHMAQGALESGCEVYAYTGADAKEQAAKKLCALLGEGDALLIKASRGVRLEEVYNAVKQQLSE